MMMWKVTAGRGNSAVRDFLEKKIVAIGFRSAGDFTSAKSRDDLIGKFESVAPGDRAQSIRVRAAQAWRFMHEVAVGDAVITYDPQDRVYHLGRIDGGAAYRADLIEDLPIARAVVWERTASRDGLSVATRHSLGAILTIFRVPDMAAKEIKALAETRPSLFRWLSWPPSQTQSIIPTRLQISATRHSSVSRIEFSLWNGTTCKSWSPRSSGR